MEIRDWFILVSTFFVGAFSGIYLYMTAYAPTYEDRNIFDEIDEVPETPFDVFAFQYGGLLPEEYENATFEVDNTGTYTYMSGGLDSKVYDSLLPEVLRKELHDAIAVADLDALSTEVVSKCTPDQTGYEYSIERKEVEYILNTCTSNFSHETELGETLKKMWQYMGAPEEHRISVSNTSDNAEEVGEVDVKEAAAEKKRIILNPIKYLEQGFEDAFGE